MASGLVGEGRCEGLRKRRCIPVNQSQPLDRLASEPIPDFGTQVGSPGMLDLNVLQDKIEPFAVHISENYADNSQNISAEYVLQSDPY